MKCEYGLCLCCEKEIISRCTQCGTGKPNSQYTEVHLNLSNGSKMPVAVCLGCKDKVFTMDREVVMEAVRTGWHKEHDAMNWSREKRENYWKTHGESLYIVD